MSQTQCSACPNPPTQQCPACLAIDLGYARTGPEKAKALSALRSREYRARQRLKPGRLPKDNHGGQNCLEKYGREFYAELGRKSAAKRRQKP